MFIKRLFLLMVLVFSHQLLYAQDTTRISLLFAGDVMGHDSQIASAWDPVRKVYDYTDCFRHVRPYIEYVDLAITNLEVTLAGPPFKGYPQFSSPDALATTLKDVGFDVLVTSNNHCVDRGKKGLERTITVLDSMDIPHTGTFKDSAARAQSYPLMVHKNGFAIAVLNYTYGTNGLPVYKPNIVNLLDTVIMKADLQKARELKPDFIIVFTHWGSEYESLPSKKQKDLTEFCFRNGATLVIGAHPHVIQPMEWRKDHNQFVAYSLGNFVSGQRKRYTDGGSMAYVEMEKIIYNADSSVTRIDTAGYYLQWVYRTADARKDYYILPVSGNEKASLAFAADALSRSAFSLFAQDSRSLSAKYNRNVNEITTAPDTAAVTYKVHLLTTAADEDPWKILTAQKEYIWGIEREAQEDGSFVWTSGRFNHRDAAEAYRQKYFSQHPSAAVVKYAGRKRVP